MTTKRGQFQVPQTSALVAFESAARHGNYSLAARELGVSQSSVSHHIGNLEKEFSLRLFERSGSKMSLTEPGKVFYNFVIAGLKKIDQGTWEAINNSTNQSVSITCSYDSLLFYIMPQYDSLLKVLETGVQMKFQPYQQKIEHFRNWDDIDLVFSWDLSASKPEDHVAILKEEVQPVCSPAYAANHSEILNGPVSGWSDLTFIDLLKPNQGWAEWSDWFDVVGHPAQPPRFLNFDSYCAVVGAATDSFGIALGWKYMIDRFLKSGVLTKVSSEYVQFDRYFYCVITSKGSTNQHALRLFELFRNKI